MVKRKSPKIDRLQSESSYIFYKDAKRDLAARYTPQMCNRACTLFSLFSKEEKKKEKVSENLNEKKDRDETTNDSKK